MEVVLCSLVFLCKLRIISGIMGGGSVLECASQCQ